MLNVFEISPPLNSLLHFKGDKPPSLQSYLSDITRALLTVFFPLLNFYTCELEHVLLA